MKKNRSQKSRASVPLSLVLTPVRIRWTVPLTSPDFLCSKLAKSIFILTEAKNLLAPKVVKLSTCLQFTHTWYTQYTVPTYRAKYLYLTSSLSLNYNESCPYRFKSELRSRLIISFVISVHSLLANLRVHITQGRLRLMQYC
jgi:hypothetical protein